MLNYYKVFKEKYDKIHTNGVLQFILIMLKHSIQKKTGYLMMKVQFMTSKSKGASQ